jgi:hypothetical protein
LIDEKKTWLIDEERAGVRGAIGPVGSDNGSTMREICQTP